MSEDKNVRPKKGWITDRLYKMKMSTRADEQVLDDAAREIIELKNEKTEQGHEIERLRGVIKERETLLFDWLENGDMPGSDGPMEKTLFLFRKIGGEDE